MVFTNNEIDQMFTYQPPALDQVDLYNTLRDEARMFAHRLVQLTPPCPDQSAAIRKLRECIMTANSAIAHRGRF
jgi:hypothetical protein